MTVTRLDSEGAAAWLSAGLVVSRPSVHLPERFPAYAAALVECVAELPALPAPMVALDLAALVAGDRLEALEPPEHHGLREALRGWEDHVLARLSADVRFERIQEAVARAPAALRPRAVALLVGRLLTRLEVFDGVALAQAQARRFAERPLQEALEEGQAALEHEATCALLAGALQQLSRAARRSRELLTDAEVFLVENIEALKGLAARVLLTQLAEVAQRAGEGLPKRPRAGLLAEGDAPTALEDESAFPAGGFSSITTSGTPENLVTSELVYMDGDGEARPDLFDVRFVEGELLYYARDEGMTLRRRRRLAFVVDPSLDAARVVLQGEKHQRVVQALGNLVAVVRQLFLWLDSEALEVRLDVPVDAAQRGLLEESRVVALLLREFAERGRLAAVSSATVEQALASARERVGPRGVVVRWGSSERGGADLAVPLEQAVASRALLEALLTHHARSRTPAAPAWG